MTQKELSYVEDAIGHEDNIIKIINVSIDNLEDANLISFMNGEISKHEKMHEKLIDLLKENSHEW